MSNVLFAVLAVCVLPDALLINMAASFHPILSDRRFQCARSSNAGLRTAGVCG